MPVPFTQTTVSIWTHLRPKLLEYCDLLGIKASVFVNDLLSESFSKIEANQSYLQFLIIDRIRRKIGKDGDVRVSEMIHRQFAGIDPVAEAVKEAAGRNTSRAVPLLLRAKRRDWPNAKACQLVCGCIETELTRQLASLYDSPLTSEAAVAKIGSSTPPALVRTYGEAYRIFLEHGIALAAAREVPPRFQPLFD